MEKLLFGVGAIYSIIGTLSYFYFMYVDFHIHGFMYFMFFSSWIDGIKATLWPLALLLHYINETQAYGILW